MTTAGIQIFSPDATVGEKEWILGTLLGLGIWKEAVDTVLTGPQVEAKDIAKEGADKPFAGSHRIP